LPEASLPAQIVTAGRVTNIIEKLSNSLRKFFFIACVYKID
jgi:hypothetical protein